MGGWGDWWWGVENRRYWDCVRGGEGRLGMEWEM